MQVKEIMTTAPITITKNTLLPEALELMQGNSIRRLLVVDDKGKLIDIVTKKDLNEVSASPATSLSIFELNYLLAKTTIGDILKVRKDRPGTLVTIDENALVGQAAVLLREYKIGGLPVMSGDKVVGIVTESDIFDVFITVMGYKEPGTRLIIEIEEDKEGTIKDISEIIFNNHGNIQKLLAYLNKEGKYMIELRITSENDEKIIKELKEKSYVIKNIVSWKDGEEKWVQKKLV